MREMPSFERLPMPIGYFRLILRAFGSTPERRAAIMAGTGVREDELRLSTTEITLFQQLQQIANVEALVGEDWVLTPALRGVEVHGALSVAVLAAPDLGAAMAALVRLGTANAPYSRWRLEQRAGSQRIVFEVAVALDAARWRPMVEVALIGIHALMAALLGREPIEAEYALACPAPAHAAGLAAVLGGPTHYEAAFNGVTFPRQWADIASPFADAVLFGAMCAGLSAALQRLTAPLALRGRVERLLAAMPDGRIAAPAVARQLGVSPRTLVRRLGGAGTSFRVLLDNEMRGRAERLLAGGGLSHAVIAAQLGYDDATSFSRACRRWFRA